MSDGFAPEIAAIPTEFRGVSFRSRTEARWAIFFDRLGIVWEYEPQGYALDGVAYLPDFWLPELGCFWEVKGVDSFDSEKVGRLADVTKRMVYVAVGPPKLNDDNVQAFFGGDGWDLDHRICECPVCGTFGVQFQGRAERNRCGCLNPNKDEVYTSATPRLVAAYDAVAAHRFWDPKVTA